MEMEQNINARNNGIAFFFLNIFSTSLFAGLRVINSGLMTPISLMWVLIRDYPNYANDYPYCDWNEY
ncbi:MAG: hypothetical protein DHS20C01_36280 [marine bacterium B5-7]|nr:MAG: hypothetical protein DHS20C01_36280 [marine bacterium B5-7]